MISSGDISTTMRMSNMADAPSGRNKRNCACFPAEKAAVDAGNIETGTVEIS